MPEIAAILFDFDGTLTEPSALDFPALRRAVGCPTGEPILEYLSGLPAADQERARVILAEVELLAARQAQPNRDAVAVLAQLAAAGWPMAILTRNTHASVLASLANFPPWVAPLFTVIISRDEPIAHKPSPAGVLLAAARLGLPPESLVVVGDYRYDIEAGHAAGAHTVYLRNGEDPDEPMPVVPDAMIDWLAELPVLLPARPGLLPANKCSAKDAKRRE